jgi:hypothetical protein
LELSFSVFSLYVYFQIVGKNTKCNQVCTSSKNISSRNTTKQILYYFYKMSQPLTLQDVHFIYTTKGSTQVWYWKHHSTLLHFTFMGDNGANDLEKQALSHVDIDHLENTHALIGLIDDANPERVFKNMQAGMIEPTWADGKHANLLLDQKGVMHTSMSIGDMLVVDNTVYACVSRGFIKIGQYKDCNEQDINK